MVDTQRTQQNCQNWGSWSLLRCGQDNRIAKLEYTAKPTHTHTHVYTHTHTHTHNYHVRKQS